jgi:hypothetical protein
MLTSRRFLFAIARAIRTAWFTIVLSLLLFCPTLLVSQQSEAMPTVDSTTVQKLLDRIATLEATQKQLLERVAQLEKPTAQTSLDPSPKGPLPVPDDPPAGTTVSASSHGADHTSATQAAPAQVDVAGSLPDSDHMDVSKTSLNIRGFGDFGLYGGNQKGQTTSFSVGQTNLFITSNLSERLRFLTEMVFEVHSDNAFQVDLERVLLEGSINDYLKISGGRYHTAIGYYNTAYHHSTWFQTATERPYIFEYEDEGGILPIHMVGMQASGQIPSGKLGLHYVAEAGNGRTSDPLAEPVQNYVDENGHKAFNAEIFAQPDGIPGLQTGFSIYRDVLAVPASPKVGETIADAYVVVARPRFEWLNEALMIRHAPAGEHVFETPSFYSQISERYGQFRPYLRYQYVNASSHEPVFPQVGLRAGPSVGMRFDATDSIAFKLQYDYTEMHRQLAINGKGCVQLSMCAPSAVGMQVDFKF